MNSERKQVCKDEVEMAASSDSILGRTLEVSEGVLLEIDSEMMFIQSLEATGISQGEESKEDSF